MIKREKTRRIIGYFIFLSFIVYIMAFLYFTVGKVEVTEINDAMYRANFVPFKTILGYIKLIEKGTIRNIAIINLMGNLLLALPLAVYLPYYIKSLRKWWKTFFLVVIIILVIEFVEMISGRGSFDIDDVILNSLGGLLGYAIWKFRFVQRIVNCIQEDK